MTMVWVLVWSHLKIKALRQYNGMYKAAVISGYGNFAFRGVTFCRDAVRACPDNGFHGKHAEHAAFLLSLLD